MYFSCIYDILLRCIINVWSLYLFFLFFFFKQKTAYEMRISDWSSDVCSSDLPAFGPLVDHAFVPPLPDTGVSLSLPPQFYVLSRSGFARGSHIDEPRDKLLDRKSTRLNSSH